MPLSRFVLALAALLMACAGCQSFTLEPPAASQIRADRDDVVDDREIVVLAESQSEAQELILRATARQYELTRRDDLGPLGLVQIVLRIPPGRPGAQAIAELERLVRGVTAGVNHAYRTEAQSSPRLYANQVMNWPPRNCRVRNRIGILDSLHPDMPSYVVSRQVADGAPEMDRHGLAVSSLVSDIAEVEAGDVVVAGVVGETVNGARAAGVDDLLRGLSWLLEQDVRLINVSLAGPYNKILDRGIQRAAGRGIIVVAAVGNAGPEAPPRYPAALRDVIAVTAIDANYSVYGQAVRGNHVDVAAPGVDVYISGKTRGYHTGTSFAAPFVTAFLSLHTDLPPSVDVARQLVEESARDLGDEGRDHIYGAGLLQADDAC